MARSYWRGLDEIARLFDVLPADAEAALKEELPKAAAAILALEKAEVPIRTGDLWRGLVVEQLADGLKVRAGLLSSSGNGKANRDLFYGRIVEFGRHAQTVLVERRRRVGGKLRTLHRRKIAADIVATYSMKVAAAPARPFVDTPATEAIALGALEDVAAIIQDRLEH